MLVYKDSGVMSVLGAFKSERTLRTGDETCDQNYDADDLKQALAFLYGWTLAGEWTVEELLPILAAGKNIREYVENNTDANGNEWIRTYLGNAVFHHSGDARPFVFPSHDVFLRDGDDQFWALHELGHVLDNNIKNGIVPATLFGGGPADEMLMFVGGNPDGCFPRFQCNSNYIGNISGPEYWPAKSYGNNSVADDFAHTFAYVIMGDTAPVLRASWMAAYINALATYVP